MPPCGQIEVIVGGMYSGKTEELIRRLRRAQYARIPLQAFKPMIDNRYHAEDVTSHDQNSFQAQPVRSAREILTSLKSETQIVGIDEGQFFADDLIEVCNILADRGIRVLIAGLDVDWQAKPFGPMPLLMAIADTVTKQQAVCMVCGQAASRTQRVNISNQEKIMVGSFGVYEARCRTHFKSEVVPASVHLSEMPI